MGQVCLFCCSSFLFAHLVCMDGRENMIGRRIQSLFIKLLITVVDPRSGVFERPASCWQSSLAGAAEAAKLLVDSCQ